MKRFLLLLCGAALAGGIWLAINGSLKAQSAPVTSLLPGGTLAMVHLPDFTATREQWHQSDLYKLWTEPAVQQFLQRPLTKARDVGNVRDRMQELEELGVKDGFLALTAWEENRPKLAGGFRFKGSAADAERVIGKWRGRLQENAPNAETETIKHRHHRLEVVRPGAITVATAYYDEWFFAANDVEVLKTLLDRADKSLQDDETLGAEENFVAAVRHMPSTYAAMAYGRLDKYFEQLSARMPAGALTGDNLDKLRQIRSAAAATAFENGKIRDVLFVAMPKPTTDAGELTRASLSIATTQSFLYVAKLINLTNQLSGPNAPAGGFPGGLQRVIDAIVASGITFDEWNSAFGSELGLVGEWPENSRIPALFATLPVKDATNANRIVGKLTTSAAPEGTGWTTSTSDGVQLYSMPPPNPMVPVTPAIAVTEKLLIAGIDPASVQAASKRTQGGDSGLGANETFTDAESLVRPGGQSFIYVDTALLYTRLDAAVRPMLVMAAAFVPSIAQAVDLSLLPPADVVTRHLSPIVVSQNYKADGYVTEAVGPVSIFHAAVGIARATGAGAKWFQPQTPSGSPPPANAPAVPILPAPADASPSPAATP